MKNKRILFVALTIMIYWSFQTKAQMIVIPIDQPTIQDGIDAATDGDTVLVNPGEYFENVNLRGKNILLTSNYAFTNDLNDIEQTIINGSQPIHEDTASCILIVSGETRDCVISGFTLTGGTGTRWEDEHNRGSWYTEGGGILIQYSSPTIKNNVIHDNEAVNRGRTIVSAGGGAIRMGDSNPAILNNYISHNQGRYGAGLVLNYTGAIIKNNVIVSNTGGQDYGGGGIWVLGTSDDARIIENNTILKNDGSSYGGGIRLWNTDAIVTNNVIRENNARFGAQISGSGTITYCNVEGGRDGEGNIDEMIRFTGPDYIIPDGNASIDAGNPHSSYNDPENPEDPGTALYPSKGSLTNDIGAYGGPGAKELQLPALTSIIKESAMSLNTVLYPNPVSDELFIEIMDFYTDDLSISIVSMNGSVVYRQNLERENMVRLNLDSLSLPSGVYTCLIESVSAWSSHRFVKR